MDENVNVRIEPEYTEKQTIAIRALRRPGSGEVMYGGAKGGGKSHLGCLWMYIEAIKDIQRYNIEPRKNPLCLGYMGRMVAKDFKDTTLETWKRIIPENGYEIKGNPPEIVIAGRRICQSLYRPSRRNREGQDTVAPGGNTPQAYHKRPQNTRQDIMDCKPPPVLAQV